MKTVKQTQDSGWSGWELSREIWLVRPGHGGAANSGALPLSLLRIIRDDLIVRARYISHINNDEIED